MSALPSTEKLSINKAFEYFDAALSPDACVLLSRADGVALEMRRRQIDK